MPKKQPRNSFYFFMIDWREEQKKLGITYQNMKELADAAGPAWQQALPKVRAKFEAIAKEEKQKNNVPTKKFTSTGISLAEIERREQSARDAETAERQDIHNFVTAKSVGGQILHEDIYLMDVNFFCKANNHYLICESTILRFSLKDGIKDHYHEIINAGHIPVGYASDVKLGCQDLGMEMPDESVPRTNLMQVLSKVIDFLKQQRRSDVLPPLFTMPDKVDPVYDFVQQMCYRASEEASLFRVYKLDTAYCTLVNALRTRSSEGFPQQSLALADLRKDKFKYNPGLGCELHERTDKSTMCSLSRVKRWAYTMLDTCCPLVGIEATPPTHLPHDIDLPGVLTYKEERRERAGPTVAGMCISNNSSFFNSSLNTSTFSESDSASTTTATTRAKRVYVPVRLPKAGGAPPALTRDHFPELSAGRGRGRNLSSSLDKMKL